MIVRCYWCGLTKVEGSDEQLKPGIPIPRWTGAGAYRTFMFYSIITIDIKPFTRPCSTGIPELVVFATPSHALFLSSPWTLPLHRIFAQTLRTRAITADAVAGS